MSTNVNRIGLTILTYIVVAVLIGMLGFKYIVGLNWVDAFTNAAQVLSGTGEVDKATNTEGKIFTGIYALFGGIFFLILIALLVGEIVNITAQEQRR